MKGNFGLLMKLLFEYMCTHKFHKIWSCKISKTNRKIMRTKYLFKLKYCGYNLKKVIFFPKEYFPYDSFTLITLWKTTMTFSGFRRSIEGHN